MYFFFISPITCSGKRTVSLSSYWATLEMVETKVLSDERTAAYAETIQHINYFWLNCKECDWYKSEQTVLPEARLSIYLIEILLKLFIGSLLRLAR